VERDEAEIFHKTHVTVPDPQAERAEFLAALRAAEETAEEARDSTSVVANEMNLDDAKKAEEKELESIEEEEEWEIIGEGEEANINGELLAILFDYDFEREEKQNQAEGKTEEGETVPRRKRKKVKIGSYDEGMMRYYYYYSQLFVFYFLL
jgi:hypothetical protein